MATFLLQPDRPATFRVAFPADLHSARAAAGAIRGFLAEHGAAEGELFSCESCLVEAGNNAVEYAQKINGRDHAITIDAICSADQIELRVTDHTAGFELPERPVLPSPMSERGRGLFIIQSTMDEVVYLRGAEENVLVMRLQRVGGGSPPRTGGSAVISAHEARRQLSECKRTMEGLVRELSFRSETLSMIFRWCTDLGRVSDPTNFTARLLEDLIRLTAADWYVLRLVHPDARDLELSAVSPSSMRSSLQPTTSTAAGSRGIEAAVAASQDAALFDARRGGTDEEPLNAIGPEARGLVYPLCFGGKLIGTLAIGRRKGSYTFEEFPSEVVRIFSAFIALQAASLHKREEELREQFVLREMEIGRKIQQALLPFTLPELPGYGLSGGWQSAREIGGDFYDAVALSDQSILLMMVDVMGKGVPAALFATHVRGILRGLSVRAEDPANLLNRLNRLLFSELSTVNMFVTALVVVVDAGERTVTAASAGHCAPMLVAGEKRMVSTITTHGIPLGILPDTVYHSETAPLGNPGILFLHTDGLTDTRNHAGEMYGQQRLMEWVRENCVPGRSATELRGRLLAEINQFRDANVMADDQAFLFLVEEKPVPVEATEEEPK